MDKNADIGAAQRTKLRYRIAKLKNLEAMDTRVIGSIKNHNQLQRMGKDPVSSPMLNFKLISINDGDYSMTHK